MNVLTLSWLLAGGVASCGPSAKLPAQLLVVAIQHDGPDRPRGVMATDTIDPTSSVQILPSTTATVLLHVAVPPMEYCVRISPQEREKG